VLDEALGLLDDHLGDLHVARGGLVEGRADTTSPFTERCMSVTSSGRSSMSSTMSTTSGWLVAMALAMFCSSTVLPARGGETIRQRWPLPMGTSRSMMRVELFFGRARG
jgi:hypothetical protein